MNGKTKLTQAEHEVRAAKRYVERAANNLSDAGAILARAGFTQPSRAMQSAAQEAAQAIAQAEVDAGRAALNEGGER